ncbi:MAG: amidase [Chloroflexi bacterium]|nr:amidase [Chloroflexota bacterium]
MTVTALDAFAPAHAMVGALRERRMSSTELVELHLERIARYNQELNAIVVPATDPLAAAGQADERRLAGGSAALLGLPLTLKESMNVRGMPVTAGVRDFADYRSADDGAIPARVLGAGAVLLGKTNVPPMLADWQSDNPIYGRTVNPWDVTRTPGGSTGGGAAAVAAGLSPLEFGSDIGGSIRVPAAFCGVFGHKPSETAVPRSGQFAVPVLPNAAAVMAVQGPLARSAEDLELALNVIAGPEVGEDAAWRLDLPPARAERLADFRVAVLPPIPWQPVSSEIMEALDGLAARLGRAGTRVRVTQPEAFGDLRQHTAVYMSMLAAFMASRMPANQREAEAEIVQRHSIDTDFVSARVAGFRATLSEWLQWHAQREAYRAAYRAFFKDWDVLLTPITLVTAFPHTPVAWPPDETNARLTVDVDGQPVPYFRQVVYPGIATLTGQPSTTFPVGVSRAGLPMGVQAIGPYLEDRTTIRFAGLATREFGGFTPPPRFS